MMVKLLLVLTWILGQLDGTVARISIDLSQVTLPEHIQAMQELAVTSLFAVPSTSKFTLKVNDQAMQGISHLFNNSMEENVRGSRGQDGNATDFFKTTVENQNSRLSPLEEKEMLSRLSNLNAESKELIHAVITGKIHGDLTITPTDEEFDSALEIMQALRTRWFPIKNSPDPKVEMLDDISVPEEIEQNLETLIKGEQIGEEDEFYNSVSPLHVASEHIQHMLSTVFNVTRNHETAPIDKFSAIIYITRKFDSFGLMVMNHMFSAAEYFVWFDEPLQGINVIGILAGINWGTEKDHPVILGAHLDTVQGTPGLNDNGSGLAALVEAARVLSSSGCFFQHSIIFVAFDLEEIGTEGSLMFVKDFLVKSLIKKFNITYVTGAFILDCISNWDADFGTQDFPEPWSELLPEVAKSIAQHNNSGDFLAVLYRTQVDSHLAQTLARYYGQLGQDKYRIELMGLQELGADLPDHPTLVKHFDFIRSDHVRFWYMNDSVYTESIPAILITDMGPYRGRMRECYHQACDSLDEGFGDLGIVTKITQSVTWALADLAQGKCGPRGRLNIHMLFSLMGLSKRHDTEERVPLTSIQGAMEILHFLGLIPAMNEHNHSP